MRFILWYLIKLFLNSLTRKQKRLLEFKVFENKLNSSEIVNYIRSFNITEVDERFVSNILMTNTLKTVKEVTQISCIDNYYLDKKQLQKMLDYEF